MAKLLFKESPFTNTVIYSLNNCLDYLNDANQQIYSMSIPGDFSKKVALENSFTEIRNVRKKVIDLKSWGEDSCQKIGSAIKDMNSVATLLPKNQLQVRNNVVR